MDACFPGMASDVPATCGPDDVSHAEWILARSCEQLFLDAGNGKADGVPQLSGVKIRREGNLTYFSVPLARTSQNDRGYLYNTMIEKFTAKMGELNATMIDHGLDLSGVMSGPTAAEFLRNYTSTIESIIGSDTSEDVAVAVGETVAKPKKLSSWQRYLIPQMYLAYFSAKVSAGLGLSGGTSVTVVIAVQPWLTIAVDHTLRQPKIVSKSYEVDTGVLGIPNVSIGLGAGGGAALRLGLGAVFGPADSPRDLAGTGIGLSGALTLPIFGGVTAKMISVLKYPPLIVMMLGYSTGTAAEAEIQGNVQQILDLEQLLVWVGQNWVN